MMFRGLLIVSVAVLQNAVGVAVPAASSWIKRPPFLGHAPHHLQRHVRDIGEGTDPCTDVVMCYRNNENSLAFHEALGRFVIKEVYTASQSWCNATQTVMEECWNDQCDDQNLRNQMTLEDAIKSWVCPRRESFNTASTCFQGPLGEHLGRCAMQAISNLRQDISTYNPTAFTNKFRRCGHDVIDDLLAPCQEENINFVKEFFDHVVELSVIRMGAVLETMRS